MNIDETLKVITEEIANMISTKTVVGEHIVIEGRTIIPVTKVSFGFGSGGVKERGKQAIRAPEPAEAEELASSRLLFL